MKYISVITGTPLTQVQGVNYFIKSFIGCNEYFRKVKLNRVYSTNQCLNIENGDTMPIGCDVGTTSYVVKTFVRTMLRKLLTSKFYPFALFRYEFNRRIYSKNSINNFFKDEAQCDYVIFQELSGAEYYFKHKKGHEKTNNIKTALIIHSEDDSGRMLLEKFKGYGRKDMERRLLNIRDYVYARIDKVIYISQKAYNSSILPYSKKVCIYNGSPDIPYSFDISKKDIIQFVCVGSMDGRKGQDVILAAMHLMESTILNRLHVTFIGDGNEYDNIQDLSKRLGLSDFVTFTGRRNDVPELLKGKDVFIMPSTVEGLPMSAIEALRAGLFLILTDTGGNAELCSDECGIVCSRDPKDVMSKMIQVLDSCIIDIKQKNRCRNRFLESFSLKVMSDNYESLILSL